MKRLTNYNRFFLIFWIVISIPLVGLAIIFSLIMSGSLGFMPTFEDLENPDKNIASEVMSIDSQLLGTYYYQNRSFVDYENISPHLIHALIATEDIRFYKHSGIDFRGLGRVLFKTILMGSSSSGGGSTISQQLAKNLFPRDTIAYNSRITRKIHLSIVKFKEWITAVKLERNYTKNEIMMMYLNTVPFGSQAYGIKLAAKTFFNTRPDSLKIEQAALLVGLLKAPTKYSPKINPKNSIERRNVVINQMLHYGYITEKQNDSLCRLPLKLKYLVQDHNEGLATYFREYLRILLTASRPDGRDYSMYEDFKADSLLWMTDPLYGWCNKNHKPDGSTYNLYSDGLKIFTGIDSRMQQYAEDAIKDHLKNELQVAFFQEKKGERTAPFSDKLTPEEHEHLMDMSIKRTERYRVLRNAGYSWSQVKKDFKTPTRMTVFTWNGDKDTVMTPYDSIKYYKFYLQAGFMAMDTHNGNIKAYVGGINFRHFKYDHVKVSKRQVGSTIKPFLYTIAMEEGHSPCDLVPDIPTTFYLGDTTWTPRNSGKSEYEGKKVTLKWGLANSVNYISAWLMHEYNAPIVVDLMRKMGVTSHIDAVPSLILGTSDLTLYEMVAAYNTYANKGVYLRPVFVTRVEDKNHNVLFTSKSFQEEAMSEQTAYLMLKLMENVVKHGTAVRLSLPQFGYGFTTAIAGKTGTTQNHSDGWFMGITKDITAGVWVGGEDRSIHFDNMTYGQGASMALPIWGNFFLKVYKDKKINISQDEFEKPANFNYNMDCEEVKQEIKEEDVGKIEQE